MGKRKQMIATIKKYWAIIIGILAGVIGVFFLIKSTKKENTVDNELPDIKQKIDTNNQQIQDVDKKLEQIEEQKVDVKKKITDKKDLVKILEDSKKNVPEEKKDAAAAKKNILNKTRRR